MIGRADEEEGGGCEGRLLRRGEAVVGIGLDSFVLHVRYSILEIQLPVMARTLMLCTHFSLVPRAFV